MLLLYLMVRLCDPGNLGLLAINVERRGTLNCGIKTGQRRQRGDERLDNEA